MCKGWLLDYDGSLLMHIPIEAFDRFNYSTFYKISLRRYIEKSCDGLIRFKVDLTYLDYIKIIKLCEKELTKQNSQLIVSKALEEYIERKEIYIDARSKLGIEIKKQDEKIYDKFIFYQSIVNRNMSRKLRDKQMWDSFFMCTMQKSGNFSVPGSGKTSSVLGMYAYLKSQNLIKRIVVISPKNAFGSWIDEFNICFDEKEKLDYFSIHNPLYQSAVDRREALRYNSGKSNLLLFNYESLKSYREDIKCLIDEKTLLVFDEVHKVKRIEGEIATNAIAISEQANYIVAMTGTPIPNTYLDIYNLLHLLFPNEYNNFFSFEIAKLRKPDETDIIEINKKIQPFFCRTTKGQLQVPKVNEDKVCVYYASEFENRLFAILKSKYRNNKLALMIRLLQLESDPKMLLKSLDLSDFKYILTDTLEINNIDYIDYSEEVKQLINRQDTTTKVRQCIELSREIVKQGKTIIIWCIFIDSINKIARHLQELGIKVKCIYGEVPLEDREQIINDFKQGKYQVLLTNPHTLAESVSLHMVCHDAIYYEYSYNLVHLLQSKDRIHRLGLEENQYTQYYFLQLIFSTEIGEYSLDEQIYKRLIEKEKIMLDAIEQDNLEIMPTTNTELEMIFSKIFTAKEEC